jgi:hypothetical protein
VLYHPPDQACKLSRKLLALLSGQEEASNQADNRATKYGYQQPHFFHNGVSFPRYFKFFSTSFVLTIVELSTANPKDPFSPS